MCLVQTAPVPGSVQRELSLAQLSPSLFYGVFLKAQCPHIMHGMPIQVVAEGATALELYITKKIQGSQA